MRFNKEALKNHLLNGGIILGLENGEFYYSLIKGQVCVCKTNEDISIDEIKRKSIKSSANSVDQLLDAIGYYAQGVYMIKGSFQ